MKGGFPPVRRPGSSADPAACPRRAPRDPRSHPSAETSGAPVRSREVGHRSLSKTAIGYHEDMPRRVRRQPRFPLAAGVTAGAIAILASACSPGSSPSSPTTPSRAAYDRQADAICQTFNAKLESVGAQLSSSTQVAQVEQGLESAISLAQQGTDKLEQLPRPAGESGALGAAYAAQEGQVADFKAILSAVRADSVSGVRSAVATAQASSAPLNQKFDALGLTTCGSGSGSGSSTVST